MRESRKYVIAKRVFTKAIVQSVGSALYSEYTTSQLEKSHTSFAFKISCADNTSYESESLELLADGSMVDTKKVDIVDIDFYDYTKNRYANFTITHGETHHNMLLVRGNDSNWVNGLFVRIKEIVDSGRPQENYYLKHKRLFYHLIALGTGSVLWAFVNLVIQRIVKPIENPTQWMIRIRDFFSTYGFLVIVNNWIGRWAFGYYPAYRIQSYLEKLWPSIEFDFGPEHQRLERVRRSRVQFVMIAVLLPILAAIGYDILKAIY